MNSKKAKRLRREAQAMTTGMPLYDVTDPSPPEFKKMKTDTDPVVRLYRSKGIPTTMKKCTRLMYKTMKRVAG